MYDQELVQKYSLEKVTLKQVNVGDSESVEEFSNEVNAENDHIDAIINNAGIFIHKFARIPPLL